MDVGKMENRTENGKESALAALLQERKLPDVLTANDGRIVKSAGDWAGRRLEILDILRREIYGYAPPAPAVVQGIVSQTDDSAFAGKAVQWTLSLQFDTPGGRFAFPLTLIVPKRTRRAPVFLHIAFRPEVPEKYLPAEELIDGGFAIANFCYLDVAPDAADGFKQGLPALYERTGAVSWGKISIWAWAASRVMDYLQSRDDLDRDQVAVIGHSRLGKTALWCSAQDERFSMAISNNSGCSGAALNRGKRGETVEAITRVFPFWFCDRFRIYANREEDLPFDQHFLLSLTAPRALYISSAAEDDWADPRSEFLAALAASPVYERLGAAGLVTPDRLPPVGTELRQGKIIYNLREGTHYLSRSDWLKFMAAHRQD